FSPTLHTVHVFIFLFNHTPTPQFSPLSLPAALPICIRPILDVPSLPLQREVKHPDLTRIVEYRTCPMECDIERAMFITPSDTSGDRKSTRLNSSHVKISYAVFCLKKNKYNKCRRYKE